jgi:hypothetical protein
MDRVLVKCQNKGGSGSGVYPGFALRDRFTRANNVGSSGAAAAAAAEEDADCL